MQAAFGPQQADIQRLEPLVRKVVRGQLVDREHLPQATQCTQALPARGRGEPAGEPLGVTDGVKVLQQPQPGAL